MTTLKLSKKPSETPTAKKTPVRRADPAKRDRSKPYAKAEHHTEEPPVRQRNHRHDGSLHEAQKPESRAPANKEAGDRPILRSEYKDRKFVDDKPARNEGKKDDFKKNNGRPETLMDIDSQGRVQSETTRSYADREGAYRNPPRRGGKVRDGFVASEFDKTRSNKAQNNRERFASKSATENAELPRLSKVMAERGLCSRREADDWIINGWVKVDGEIIDTLGTRVSPTAEITVSGYAKESQAENVTILLHKPVGYVSGQAEDGYEPAVVLIKPENQWPDDPTKKEFKRGYLKGIAPAGRLDIDSTGLLVLTQDGRVARHLIGEDSSVEKEYLVRVEGELSADGLKKLNHGLTLDGVALKPAKVSWQNEDQLRFVLREGKKRQIRRMCELVGLKVVGLKRIRIGSVTLGKLPMGQWRYLQANERF